MSEKRQNKCKGTLNSEGLSNTLKAVHLSKKQDEPLNLITFISRIIEQ